MKSGQSIQLLNVNILWYSNSGAQNGEVFFNMVWVRTPYSLIHGYECFEAVFCVYLGLPSKDGGSIS